MNLDRKWLVETPLAPVWRRRLELALGAVVTGALVVALGSTFRPDPAQVARLHGVEPLVSRSFPQLPEELEPSGSSQDLSNAASAGDIAGMRRSWRRDMSLDPFLDDAIRSGKLEAVRWVVAHGADIHRQDGTVEAPLLVADSHPEIVAFLQERGAAEPPLMAAAAMNASNAVLRILARSPPPAASLGEPLWVAGQVSVGTLASKARIVNALLDAGADPNSEPYGRSTLASTIASCYAGYRRESGDPQTCLDLVHVLLRHGARIDGEVIGAALSIGTAAERRTVLDLLVPGPLDKGTAAGALETATEVSLDDVPRILAGGVDWAYHDGEDDAAHPVVAAARRGDRDLLRLLLDAHAPVDVHFKDGTCALQAAIEGNDAAHARVVELLVERGANPNRRFPDGRTPLFVAAEAGGDIRIVNFLIAHGARLNDLVLEDTALDVAEQQSNLAAARIIAAHGGTHGRRWNAAYGVNP